MANLSAEWRRIVRTYPCPRCDAQPGEPCTTASGLDAEMEHRDRIAQIRRCPKCLTRLASDADPGALCSRCQLLHDLNTERATTHRRERDDVGSQLVRQVEARAMGGSLDGLTHAARLVLWCMALNAHDTGTQDMPPLCYFRGWQHLASVLGYPGLTVAGERAVARAVAELLDAGLVKPDAVHGLRKRVYRLTL